MLCAQMPFSSGSMVLTTQHSQVPRHEHGAISPSPTKPSFSARSDMGGTSVLWCREG